jgi:hypothetical protein
MTAARAVDRLSSISSFWLFAAPGTLVVAWVLLAAR